MKMIMNVVCVEGIASSFMWKTDQFGCKWKAETLQFIDRITTITSNVVLQQHGEMKQNTIFAQIRQQNAPK